MVVVSLQLPSIGAGVSVGATVIVAVVVVAERFRNQVNPAWPKSDSFDQIFLVAFSCCVVVWKKRPFEPKSVTPITQ